MLAVQQPVSADIREERSMPKYRRCRLPAVMMRSGTSKGLFLHREHLPASIADWAPLLLAAMGSQDSDLRQLNGLGGGTSTTSKVVVVSRSERPDVDVEYTFVQVAVGKNTVDMTGNCGNMCSGVAAFALDEGLVKADRGSSEVRRLESGTAGRSTDRGCLDLVASV